MRDGGPSWSSCFVVVDFGIRENVDISCEWTSRQMIHMTCQALFFQKKKESFRMSSAAVVTVR